MPRPHPRPPGLLLGAVCAALLLAACGSSSSTTTGGHDSPQSAAQGFLTALGAYDGSPTSLQNLLDWIPPSKRSQAQGSFEGLGAAGGSTRFKLENVSIGSATVDGDSAVVTVQAKLSICVSGTIGSQSYSTCPPAPISPNGSFDTLTCVREQGQWYVADYSASGGTGTATAPPPAPATGGATGTSAATTASSATTCRHRRRRRRGRPRARALPRRVRLRDRALRRSIPRTAVRQSVRVFAPSPAAGRRVGAHAAGRTP